MAEKDVVDLATALINEAADRLLLIPGARGVAITLVHEDKDMPLGTTAFPPEPTARDVILAVRRLGDSTDVLTQLLLQRIDGKSGGTRENSPSVGEAGTDGNVTECSGSASGSQANDTESTTEGATGQSR